MIVRVDRTEHVGRAIDLRGHGINPAAIRAGACRRDQGHRGRENGQVEGRVEVACRPPGPAHEHVGIVSPDQAFQRSRALAAAARSRGRVAPQAEQVAAVREQLDALDAPETGTAIPTDARRALDATAREVERLRERVAALRGQVQACEAINTDDDADGVVTTFREAAGSLADAETRKIAAEQALSRRQRDLRAVRDRREHRLRLEDRLENAARAARDHLAGTTEDEFADALDSVPGHEPGDDAETTAPVAATPVTAALATARIAAVRAPIALDCDRFAGARAATEWLDAPVVLV